MFCENCGYKFENESMFCPRCGTKRVKIDAEPAGRSKMRSTFGKPTSMPPISPTPSAPTYSAPTYSAPTPSEPTPPPTYSAPTPPPTYSAPTPPPTYSAPTPTPVNDTPVVVKVKKGSGLGAFFGILVLAIVAFGVYIFFFTNMFKSDEEMIENRLEAFENAYNDGDFEELLESFDNKTRTQIEAAIGLGESIFGGITGYGVNYSDLFGLGVAVNGGDMLNFGEIQAIEIQGDYATVTVTMILSANIGDNEPMEEIATVEMVKEDSGFLNKDWFIVNMY